jgi:hypothetical protein
MRKNSVDKEDFRAAKSCFRASAGVVVVQFRGIKGTGK